MNGSLKAFKVVWKGMPYYPAYYAAETSSKARHMAMSDIQDGGWSPEYKDIQVVRSPEYADLAKKRQFGGFLRPEKYDPFVANNNRSKEE